MTNETQNPKTGSNLSDTYAIALQKSLLGTADTDNPQGAGRGGLIARKRDRLAPKPKRRKYAHLLFSFEVIGAVLTAILVVLLLSSNLQFEAKVVTESYEPSGSAPALQFNLSRQQSGTKPTEKPLEQVSETVATRTLAPLEQFEIPSSPRKLSHASHAGLPDPQIDQTRVMVGEVLAYTVQTPEIAAVPDTQTAIRLPDWIDRKDHGALTRISRLDPRAEILTAPRATDGSLAASVFHPPAIRSNTDVQLPSKTESVVIGGLPGRPETKEAVFTTPQPLATVDTSIPSLRFEPGFAQSPLHDVAAPTTPPAIILGTRKPTASLDPAPQIATFSVSSDAGAAGLMYAALPVLRKTPPRAEVAPQPVIQTPEPRVVIHFQTRRAQRNAQALGARFAQDGLPEVEYRVVDFDIRKNSVRYFFDSDAELATRVSQAAYQAGRVANTRDFTHYRPRPRSGTVELWLSE
jgi:hypothetical protein